MSTDRVYDVFVTENQAAKSGRLQKQLVCDTAQCARNMSITMSQNASNECHLIRNKDFRKHLNQNREANLYCHQFT